MLIKKELLEQIQTIISQSKNKAVRSVNFERVLMYHKIGKVIFEEEQEIYSKNSLLEKNKLDDSSYTSLLLAFLSENLEPNFGSGFSKYQLEMGRKFYRLFPNLDILQSQLSWSHYRFLIDLDNEDKIEFYAVESIKNNWSAKQLERQVNSQLFERLLMSNNLKDVLAVARQEKTPIEGKEIIKDPMILEFLDLKRETSYYEKDLETAIIDHLQDFLLELGNGFSFVARQKRIHLEGDDFFIDLVFYNRLLQSFVIIEIKTNKLTHEDIGQLQMYVNYYDRYEKQEFENPTIGILLCADKNDAVVKITLPKDNKTIFASKYQLYLPTEQQLIDEIKKEIKKLDDEE